MNNISDWGQSVANAISRMIAQRRCLPVATYRLQFSRDGLTFREAATLVPYLDQLGISHIYASPYLKTKSGSTHGYAIVDYCHLNPELGNEEDYRSLVVELHSRNMGQILDIVSNHMSATPAENSWWNDVLENGPCSPYAAYFDIDWQPVKEQLRNKLLLPILGGQYGQVLESGELQLEYGNGAFFIKYYQMLLPLDPQSYRLVLTRGLDELKKAMPSDSDEVRELESILTALEHLPLHTDLDPDHSIERQREKEVIKNRLGSLVERASDIAGFIQCNVARFNGSPDDPSSFDDLDKLLDAQAYRLAHWKAAADEINYRRFFDINELAAVCMEDPKVFHDGHKLIFDLLVRGDVSGLRVDHIDGLYDPMEYLRRLQWGYLRALGREAYGGMIENGGDIRTDNITTAESGEPPPWSDVEPAFLEIVLPPLEYNPNASNVLTLLPTIEDKEVSKEVLGENVADNQHVRDPLPLYLVVEKILSTEEPLPDKWLVAGTTGYDFLNSANGLFVDTAGLMELTKIYERFIDERLNFREIAQASKVLILKANMSSDLQLLAYRLNRISERHRRSRDFTLNTLRLALREILACFPIYRTYIREGDVSDRDKQFICRAVAQAKRRNPTMSAAVFDFIRDVLLLQLPVGLDDVGRTERALFVGRFQQVTSPVMAKGVEDTAFYRYFPLASINEVGGDPAHGAVEVEEFHRQNTARQMKWTQSLISTTTHDTKRSEDTRARINVLSEVPHLWRKAVNRWARLNRRHHCEVDGKPAPSRNDEYLFYQSLFGIWPLDDPDDAAFAQLIERLQIYMEKATREAKQQTSWINPVPEYDAAMRDFVAAVLKGRAKNRFLKEFCHFHEQAVNWGLFGSLSQTLLKLTSPGVPDIYNGQEIWDFSLVDPDNRRPVEFFRIWEMLAQIRTEIEVNDQSLLVFSRRLCENPRDPRLKLFVTWRALQFRCRNAELFQLGQYTPLEIKGSRAMHVCAFEWTSSTPTDMNCKIAVVIAPRMIAKLTPLLEGALQPPLPVGPAIWEDTHIAMDRSPISSLTNVFTGQTHSPDQCKLMLANVMSDFPVALLSNLPYE